MLGKPVLAEDEVAVETDVEDAATALDQLGLNAVLLLDHLRQTGGFGQVVSFSAVFDGHFHVVLSSSGCQRILAQPSSYSRWAGQAPGLSVR